METMSNEQQPTTDIYPYDSRQIANWFIRRAEQDGRSMSIMQVLKLVYMAHGWSLASLDRPLVIDGVEAWQYGPVISTIYYSFRPQGVYSIKPFEMYERPLDDQAHALLYQVYDMYKDMPAWKLSGLTHMNGGPWDRTFRSTGEFARIPENLIAEHYKDKLERMTSAYPR